jgi:hypothetical protein
VDLVSLVSNNDQRLDQNLLRNILSQFDMMFYGILKCAHTRPKNIGSGLHCDILITGCGDGHLRKPINHHKKTFISFLGSRKA